MNTARLLKVLQWNIISNKRDLRRTFTGMVTAFCIITAISNISAWSNHFASYANTMSSAKLCYVGACFALLLSASEVCFNMATKTKFINYAMLPATNLEKYVSNVLYQTLCRIVIMLAAFVATDALQAIVSLAVAGNANSLVVCGISALQQLFADDDILPIAVFCIFAHSTFLLGGTLFRRRQFLLTCLMWVAVPFAVSMLALFATGVATYFYNSSDYDVYFTLWFSPETYDALYILALLAATCLCYWLSYRRFRRSQVINNRFYN